MIKSSIIAILMLATAFCSIPTFLPTSGKCFIFSHDNIQLSTILLSFRSRSVNFAPRWSLFINCSALTNWDWVIWVSNLDKQPKIYDICISLWNASSNSLPYFIRLVDVSGHIFAKGSSLTPGVWIPPHKQGADILAIIFTPWISSGACL